MEFPTGEPTGPEQEQAEDLCHLVFAGMTRADQRRTGQDYVLGLLTSTAGRKTIRGIAACEKEQSAYEQRLHHFISRSTWSSRDVLGRLADHLQAVDVPRGWVIRPMVVEKHGAQSVGVKNEVVPCLGKVVNHQHVLATWFMGRRLTIPTDWRMVVPRSWTADDARRARAGIPERNDSPTASHAAAALIRALRPADRDVPVIMDAREADAARVIAAAQRKGVPYLLRVPGSTSVLTASGTKGAAPVPVRARRLTELFRSQGRPVAGTPIRTATRTPVQLPGPDGPIHATLMGVWCSGAGWAGVWLTDLDEDLGLTVARTDLVAEADDAFTSTARTVGAVDYEGRSYQGWYHHMAMVSVAHTVRAQVRSEEEQLAALAQAHQDAVAGEGDLLEDHLREGLREEIVVREGVAGEGEVAEPVRARE